MRGTLRARFESPGLHCLSGCAHKVVKACYYFSTTRAAHAFNRLEQGELEIRVEYFQNSRLLHELRLTNRGSVGTWGTLRREQMVFPAVDLVRRYGRSARDGL